MTSHVQQVNDTYGHLAGDETLQTVAHALTTQLRASDIICRYGGGVRHNFG
ncbi:MAG: diguanylate cyclase [Chloroflexi bacterium]|nr:diguanylate cyclase [Chloroflexota bacterium]